MREEITCDHFLDTLGDPDFALKIRERQPADLDSALRIALQLEVWKQDMNRHRDTARPERGRNVREISKSQFPELSTEATSADQPMHTKKQVEEVLASTPVTIQTSIESGSGIAPTRVSTSPLATDSIEHISRRQKGRIESSTKRHGYYVGNEQRNETTRSTTTEEQYVDQLSSRIKQILVNGMKSAKGSRTALEEIKRILRKNAIEKLWQPRILRQFGIQTDQSDDTKIGQPENREMHAKPAVQLQVRAINSKKTTVSSTTAAPRRGASTESGLSKQYKKPKRQLFNPTLSQTVEQSTSIPTTRASRRKSTAASNSSFQNYLPSVQMARTKETARKNRDDQRSSDEHRQERRSSERQMEHRDEERQQEQRDDERQRERDNRRRDGRRSRSNNSPPRRRRRASRSPLPRSYVCALCRKVNKQKTNYRCHLVMQHNIRIDGTPATAADIRQARQWSSKASTGRSARYKSREFVESGTEDDPTQEESGLSTPSRQESPSPPRNRRQKRPRDE